MKSGILLLNKPAEMTSFDCIREIKRAAKRTDLGHGGTLDRFATGLLPIFFGEALKLTRFFLEHHPQLPTYWKTYEGTMKLGVATETGDPEGEITEESAAPRLESADSAALVQKLMNDFVTGPYWQTPPRYSAKKIQGKRASDLARAGKEVELKPVLSEISEFTCLKIEGDTITFKARCSKGTYVRVLAQDLAQKLGTVSHLTALKRTEVGSFGLDQAVTLEQVLREGLDHTLLPLSQAVSFLKPFSLMVNERELIERGQIQSVLTRLSNSGLNADTYCAVESNVENQSIPIALLQLDEQKRAHFIRSFIN